MDYLKYVGLYAALIAVVWMAGFVFSKSIRDYEVIAPEKGVKCVVVSRMFNTSVDCWVHEE